MSLLVRLSLGMLSFGLPMFPLVHFPMISMPLMRPSSFLPLPLNLLFTAVPRTDSATDRPPPPPSLSPAARRSSGERDYQFQMFNYWFTLAARVGAEQSLATRSSRPRHVPVTSPPASPVTLTSPALPRPLAVPSSVPVYVPYYFNVLHSWPY